MQFSKAKHRNEHPDHEGNTCYHHLYILNKNNHSIKESRHDRRFELYGVVLRSQRGGLSTTYKIVTINGSPRGAKSSTGAFLKAVVSGLRKRIDIETYELDLSKYKVSFCRGCSNCFETGKCPLDLQDDMPELKKMILMADVLLIGTPIYAGNITAQMKLLLDRMSYWMHLMCLCGKPTALLTSSCGNGANFVKTYLSSAVMFMGGREVSFQNYLVFTENDVQEVENVQRTEEMVADIIGALNDPTHIGERERKDLDYIFHSMQKNMKLYEEEPNFEYRFWKHNGFFEFESYMDVIMNSERIISDFGGTL